ncbi:RCC1 domain-containing protein, partial [Microbacterium sp. LB16]|uniref:RCC1 domain-containing protein n=1 Tax=Microbacterium sp. LB16 TaxID=3081271 RepID=UPI003FA52D88
MLAVFVALGSGAGASAATGIDPGTGSAAGGTQVTIPALSTAFAQASAGAYHSLALGLDGKAYAWGWSPDGQLGNGATEGSSVAVAVTMPAGVTFTSVSAGGFHSLAMGSDGKAYAWGWNTSGQLGNNSTTSSSVPVAAMMPAGVTFTSVSAGISHSLAVGSDGKAYAWGYNTSGQLGNGSTTDSLVPVAVTMPAGVTFTSVSASAYHSVALGSDGKTYAWGGGSLGQLGNGSTTDSLVPVAVTMPAGVTFTSVTAGDYHSVALGSDGKAYAWGRNNLGQLGNGSTTDSLVPVAVTMPAGVTFTSVSASGYHSLALGSDGKTYAWGNNNLGQLGNGSTTDSSVPVSVTMPAGVTFTSVDAGGYHSLALGSDGNAYAWGDNGSGQLGDGSTTSSSVPVVVKKSVVVTSVVFGGTVGTGLVQNPDGSWSVTTPAHGAGAVDVVVS